MRFHLDTIPIWEAYKSAPPCPLCHALAGAEERYLDGFLGGSVMEPAMRVETNRKGFCQEHWRALHAQQKVLPVALLLHTNMAEQLKAVEKAIDVMASGGKKSMEQITKAAENIAGSCVLCERLAMTLNQYVRTLLYMYDTESDFRAAFAQSSGFCLPHFAAVCRGSETWLRGKRREDFTAVLCTIEKNALKQAAEDVYAFTQMFDYQNAAMEPGPRTKAAVINGICKMHGG